MKQKKKTPRKRKSTPHPKIAELVNKNVYIITTVSNGWPISGKLIYADKTIVVLAGCKIGKNKLGNDISGERMLVIEQIVSINEDPGEMK